MHEYLRVLITALMIAALCESGAHAQVPQRERSARETGNSRVIVLVLDGVRWQDFFDVPESRLRPDDGSPLPFEGYWQELSEAGVAFGDRSRASSARMTLPGLFSQRKSLPSYQAMLAGFAQPCPDNECARIGVETLPEALARQLELPPEKVAVFASWPGLARAATHESGTVHVDAGEAGFFPDDAGKPITREDEKPAKLALDHLRRHSPRFLFVVFDQADHAAHEGDRTGYVRALRRLDRIILRFFEAIEQMAPEERSQTTLMVTTDHGRGTLGPFWQYHALMPYATEVFVAATGPRTLDLGQVANHPRTIQHSDLRPTIEILLGLEPSPCHHPTCGQPITEMLDGDPESTR